MAAEPSNRNVQLDRHELVRRANLHNVLTVIADHAPISRAAIVQRTGLSRPTVLSVVDALAEDGLIRSAPQNTGSVGRSPLVYEPDPRAGYVVGIDLGGTKVRAALADLAGSVLAEGEESTTRDGAARPAQPAHRVSPAGWCDAVGQRRRESSGVTVGSPGVVRPDGTVHLAQNVTGLDALPLGPELSRRLRCPVRVDNDVNIAAVGELAEGVAAGSGTFAMVSIGTGIGAGIVVDGHILSGAHGGAGEVAYLPAGADPAAPFARRRGAFEVAASGSGVRAILADELHARPPADLGGTTLRPSSDARAVFEAASVGDEVALAVVDRHAALIAEALLSIVVTIDPELIVLAGGIGSNPIVLEPVRRALERIAPFPVRVETTRLGSRAGVVGAVADAQRRAWQSMYERHPFGTDRNSARPGRRRSLPATENTMSELATTAIVLRHNVDESTRSPL